MTTTTFARAWRILRTDGQTLGFTDHDGVLSFAGVTFRPDSGLSARALVQALGLSVDNTEAEGALRSDSITEEDLLAGRWDGAELTMWEVDWRDTAMRKLIFRGHVGEVSRKNGAFRAELRGLSEALNKPQGRVYHPRCSARLGDKSCAVELSNADMAVESSILGVDDARTITIDTLTAFRARWFEYGKFEVLSGKCAGLAVSVKNDRSLDGSRRQIELWSAPSDILSRGDGVRLTAGCDKSADCCRVKFNNYLNFRGFPHLPTEDWLVAPQLTRRRRDVSQV